MKTKYFEFVELEPNTPEYNEYLALRYDIFCQELQRIKVENIGEQQAIETDKYDKFSHHILAVHRLTAKPAACVRLILPNHLGLSIQHRYRIDRHDYSHLDGDSFCEISRMAITREFRKRHSDKGKPPEGDPSQEIPREKTNSTERRQHQPELVLGMYREIFALCQQRNIQCAYAAMDKIFARLLIRLGLPFQPVGAVNNDVQPPRRPYIICQTTLCKELEKRSPFILSFLMGETSEYPS